MLSTFIPGLEEFIEETPDQTNIVDPEKEIVIQEAEEAGAKEEQLNNDINNISTALEMCSAKLIELNHVREHLQKYGVDRTFLSLYNHDGLLTREFNIQLPSCESFDVVGNPNSAVSIAAIEGFTDTVKSIGTKVLDFLKKLLHKIVEFFKFYHVRFAYYTIRWANDIRQIEQILKNKSELAKNTDKTVNCDMVAEKAWKACGLYLTYASPVLHPEEAFVTDLNAFKAGVDRIKVLEFGEETLESKEVDGTSLVTGLEKAKKFLEDFLPRFEMLQQGALIVEPQVKQEISKMEAEMRKYQDNKEYVETFKQRIEQLRSLIPGYQLCFRTGLTVLRLFHKSTAGLIKAANSMLAGKTSDKKSNNPDEPIDVEAEVVDDDNNHGSSSTKALEYKP